MEELVSLLAALHNVAINSETLDQLNWVVLRYSSIQASRHTKCNYSHWPWKLIWKIKLPPRLVASAGLHLTELA
ncbi:hypothetical protein H5410_002422 [Solanum commersonii]|uniref:Uncharacterized protein n=1 Tax=Solanum commersonii TaxID=4109 RepID=A0A9J6B1W3_SOLCO|nr:hypothetical protein H5410_002422 [Solanum commersonii]